jgi:glycosyltransferase involved in cell wall biosynthesis
MTVKVVSFISRMNVGGPAVLLSNLAEALPQAKFRHVLITGQCAAGEEDYLNIHPFDGEVIYLDSVSRALQITNDVRSLFKLYKIFKNLSPDILHTHTSKAGVLGRIAIKLASPKTKIIHTYHGHLLYGYFPKWKSYLIVLIEKFLARFTDHLVAVSQNVKVDLCRKGIGILNEWSVIYPGVHAKSHSSKKQALQHLEVVQGFVIGWIGRFTDIKNPILAIETISLLKEINLVDVTLVMAGDGELHKECVLIARNFGLPIIFTGWLADTRDLFSAIDILLVTSRNEGMPVVIIEAAYNSVPVIATDVGGISEFVINNQTGWLVNQDAREISEQILTIVRNRKKIASLGEGALNLARKSYSSEKFVSAHIDLYERVLNIGN